MMRLLKFCDLNKIFLSGFVLFSLILTRNQVFSKECNSLDIRNSVTNLEKLRNCTVIKGFLNIVLIEKDNTTLWEKYSFPQLREVTGYVLVFRLFGIRTFGNLFPNLAVIRGQILFKNYAFIVSECNELSEMGLYSLISIQRGKVGVAGCPKLCYLDTIDWTRIVKAPGGNFFEKVFRPQCPSRNSCRGCKHENCWSSKYCQKYEGDNLADPTITECHEMCLGGCYNSTMEGCYLCKGPVYNEGCVEKCPEQMVLHAETNRCITPELCLNDSRIPFEGHCLDDCPAGYSKKNFETGEFTENECFKCLVDCPRICDSTEIQYLADVQYMKGCTVINGTLRIKLSTDVSMEELERNLGDIEEIHGYLKIYDSLSINSLSFFRNLALIRGDELQYEKYALVIYENYNLQKLFNWDSRKPITIQQGSMLFYLNNKLCPSEIDALRNNTKYNDTMDYIFRYTGFDLFCPPVQRLETRYKILSPHEVTVYWTQVPGVDENLLEYLLFYIESPYRNMTPYTGSDVCLANIWKTQLIAIENVQKIGRFWSYNITGLKPFTMYAYYLKTYKMLDEDFINAETDLEHFETESKVPSPPVITTAAKTPNSITLQWNTSPEYNDRITYFQVDVFLQPDKREILDSRDYCIYPLEPVKASTSKPVNAEDECCPKYIVDGEPDVGLQEPLECTEHGDECLGIHYRDSFERSMLALKDRSGQDMSKREVYKFKNFLGSYTISGKAVKFTIPSLEHYTLYTFHFFACDKKLVQCGSYYMHSERTAALPSADDIQLDIALDYYNPTDVHAHFEEPKNPNGMTVAYLLTYEKHAPGDAETASVCITRKEHEKNKYQYTFKQLNKNTAYQFRARSVSIAGYGQFTEWQFLFVYDPREDLPIRMGILSLFICFFGGIALGYWLYKTYKAKKQPTDETILLSTLSLDRSSDGTNLS